VLLRSGDPLPAPLTGTFNSFGSPVVNDSGAVAFFATTNSVDAESGIFLLAGAGVVPVALHGGFMGGVITFNDPPDLNNAMQVAYTSSDFSFGGFIVGGVYLWSAGAGSIKLVAVGAASPGGGTINRVGQRPVLNDAGVIGFTAEVAGGPDGIFTVDAGGVLVPVAYGAFRRDQTPSINASGQVAFVDGAVRLWDPAGPTTSVVAQPGDLVDGIPRPSLEREFVGVNASGDVAFEGNAGGGRRLIRASAGTLTTLAGPSFPSGASDFAPRLTDDGAIVWSESDGSPCAPRKRSKTAGRQVKAYVGGVTTVVDRATSTPFGLVDPSGPGINNAEDFVFSAWNEVLYVIDHGALRRVAGSGDPSPGSGTFTGLRSAVLRSSLYLSGCDAAGSILARQQSDGSIVRLLGTGDPAPVGDSIASVEAFDAWGSVIALTADLGAGGSALLVRAGTGALTALASTTDPPQPDGNTFVSFDEVRVASAQIAFRATVSDGTTDRQAIFRARHDLLERIVLEGDVAPNAGGDTFATLGTIAAGHDRVLFAAALAGGRGGVFVADRNGLAKVVLDGDPAPTAPGDLFQLGTVTATVPAPVAFQGSRTVFGSALSTNVSLTGLFSARGLKVVKLVLDGDPTPLGGVYANFLQDEPIVMAGRRVVAPASLTAAAGVASALVSVR